MTDDARAEHVVPARAFSLAFRNSLLDGVFIDYLQFVVTERRHDNALLGLAFDVRLWATRLGYEQPRCET
ncbi:MAG: hypothetical protein JNN30_20470 [Rhodanobacteraceae bacterium]|nr:hypothetical protein [Rhodanobacteraceae bacterium]